jgi:hypothetical protein
MAYNINCVHAQLYERGELRFFKDKSGKETKFQNMVFKIPRQNPKENERTAVDYITMEASSDAIDFADKCIPLFDWCMVDFALRSFTSKEGKKYEKKVVTAIYPVKP